MKMICLHTEHFYGFWWRRSGKFQYWVGEGEETYGVSGYKTHTSHCCLSNFLILFVTSIFSSEITWLCCLPLCEISYWHVGCEHLLAPYGAPYREHEIPFGTESAQMRQKHHYPAARSAFPAWDWPGNQKYPICLLCGQVNYSSHKCSELLLLQLWY